MSSCKLLSLDDKPSFAEMCGRQHKIGNIMSHTVLLHSSNFNINLCSLAYIRVHQQYKQAKKELYELDEEKRCIFGFDEE